MRAVLLITLLAVLSAAAQAAEVIKVPFNFQWGESAQRLEDSLARAKASVVERKQVQGRQCLVVEGIPQRLLQRALFYLDRDSLNEIELQYGDPAWGAANYSQFFDQTRKNIELKYGPGRMIAQQNTKEGDLRQTISGYQWVQQTTTLSLYFYTAERGAESFRLLSLHYRGF